MSNPYDPYSSGQQPQQPADPAAPTQFVPVQPPPQPGYGAPQEAQPWGQPAGQAPYGAPQQQVPGQPYGVPPQQPAFGQQPPQQPPAFGQAPQQPGQPAFGQQPPAFGQAPQGPYGYPTPVSQVKANRTGGAKIAAAIFGSIVGRVVVVLVLLGGVAGYHYITSDSAKRDNNGQVNQKGSLGVTDLKVGDCFDMPSGDSDIASVTAIPCTQAHDSQIFAEPAISESTYPGTDTLQTEGKTACDATDAQASISSSVPSDVDVEIFFPEEDTFNSGTDYFSCAIQSPSKDLTESFVTGS